MNPDRFLYDHYATLERRESARCVSMEGRSAGGLLAAQREDAEFAYSVGLLGTLERDGRITARHVLVFREFYLRLSVEHVAIVRMRSPGEEQARVIGVRHLAPGQAPPECAEVQSMVDWTAMGRTLGLHRRACQRLWYEARAEVAMELEARDAIRARRTIEGRPSDDA